MTLTDIQRSEVTRWIQDGLKLADIQKRLQSEFSLKLTYMEVRFLVDDLKLVPKDPEVPKPSAEIGTGPLAAPASPAPPTAAAQGFAQPTPLGTPAPKAGVSLTVDTVTRPGTLVSGKVQFSDGQGATWYLDQMGRLGLAPEQKGYRPAQADVEEFQLALERELARLGM